MKSEEKFFYYVQKIDSTDKENHEILYSTQKGFVDCDDTVGLGNNEYVDTLPIHLKDKTLSRPENRPATKEEIKFYKIIHKLKSI